MDNSESKKNLTKKKETDTNRSASIERLVSDSDKKRQEEIDAKDPKAAAKRVKDEADSVNLDKMAAKAKPQEGAVNKLKDQASSSTKDLGDLAPKDPSSDANKIKDQASSSAKDLAPKVTDPTAGLTSGVKKTLGEEPHMNAIDKAKKE